ncbi:MAG: DUF1592 domain-containing protein [Planctomycetaceae bacterium]
MHDAVRWYFSRCVCLVLLLAATPDAVFAQGEQQSANVAVDQFLRRYCMECHSGTSAPAGLDLKSLSRDLTQPDDLRRWIRMYDQIAAGTMPPADSEQPEAEARKTVLTSLEDALVKAEQVIDSQTPRLRRLTRREYENIIRDVFDMPGIALAENLPADGKAHGFDRVPEALDISHVNMAKYLEAADHILDYAICTRPEPPTVTTRRISLVNRGGFVAHIVMNGDGVLLKDGQPDPDFPPAGEQNHLDEGAHERWGSFENGASVGLFRHEDESVSPYFIEHVTIYPARYRVRTSLWSFQWDKGTVLPGRGTEAARLSVVQLTGDGRGGQHPSYVLGYFNAPAGKAMEHELTVWLNHNELIGFNAASLAPAANYYKPKRAMEFTGPGIVVDWLDIEGPLYDSWPPRSHRVLFGDLPLAEFRPEEHPGVRAPIRQRPRQIGAGKNRPDPEPGTWTVRSEQPLVDARRLLERCLPVLFRRAVSADVLQHYLSIVESRLIEGDCFELAMRAAYRGALVSPDFLLHLETEAVETTSMTSGVAIPAVQAAKLDSRGLANRLASLLWNSAPDEQLTALAETGELFDVRVLRREANRLLTHKRSQRFIHDFVGQWLRVYDIAANDPDRKLYPEFSPYLQDSMVAETRGFFEAALRDDLNVTQLVQSDFVMVNQKLAAHYNIPGVVGIEMRRVPIPDDCFRGGLLTQAAILKVTANGTTTSPVPRGAFVMDRIFGETPEPPPSSVPAIEPDVRGATTIREQLDKHRSNAVCASCHQRIDPPGFALEAFDVIGGFRSRYRSIGEGDAAERGNIDPFIGLSFRLGRPVDASGKMPDGREFMNVLEFQKIVAQDETRLLRNLAKQLLIYGTGRSPGFRNRSTIDQIVDSTRRQGGGVLTLLLEVISSPLFAGTALRQSEAGSEVPVIQPDASVVHSERMMMTSELAAVATPVRKKSTADGTVAAGAGAEAKQTSEAFRSLRVQVLGLFIPEQQAAFRSQMEQVEQAKLEALDYDRAEATLQIATDGDLFRGVSDEQAVQRLNETIQHLSRGLFGIRPLSSVALKDRKRLDFQITGLDCKACSLAVHDVLIRQEGVIHATASFRDGVAVAWIDPATTERSVLLEALKNAGVTVRDVP